MKVKQLIAELLKMNPDADVFLGIDPTPIDTPESDYAEWPHDGASYEVERTEDMWGDNVMVVHLYLGECIRN